MGWPTTITPQITFDFGGRADVEGFSVFANNSGIDTSNFGNAFLYGSVTVEESTPDGVNWQAPMTVVTTAAQKEVYGAVRLDYSLPTTPPTAAGPTSTWPRQHFATSV